MMQIDGKWDDGIAFELDLLLQLADLIPVQQQLADAGVEESVEWWQNAWETSKSAIDKLESK